MSEIKITSTNIRGSKVGKRVEEAQKLRTFLNITSDVHIVIDAHLDSNKIATIRKRHRQMLSSYSILGYPSKKRGLIVFLKRSSGCTVSKLNNNNNPDTLLFELELPDTTKIDILAVYAPSKDLPTFWDESHLLLNNSDNMHKILIGDYNCTINHQNDAE